MTPQEQQLIGDFLNRLAAIRGVAKDPQADAMIRQGLAQQPDAAYLLVQRCLLLEHALDNAKAEIERLQSPGAAQGGASFLGGSSGWQGGATPPPMPSQAPPPAPGWRERLFGGGPAYAPSYAAPPAAPSFLATAATTAAGVAGGMFLFDGIEHLMGGQRGDGLFGDAQPPMVENITENNFYDNGPQQGIDNGFNGFDQGSSDSDFVDTDTDFDDDNSWS